MAAKLDIVADRWVMCRRTMAFVGYDFTSAAFKMEIRLTRDAVGSPLVSLTTQTTDVQGVRRTYSGTDTIANHRTAARLSPSDTDTLLATKNPATGANYLLTDSILLSIVAIRIDKATMSALPFPAERGNDIDLYWDLHITPAGSDEGDYAGGVFTVAAGVTQ
jgi:hypothetical protein